MEASKKGDYKYFLSIRGNIRLEEVSPKSIRMDTCSKEIGLISFFEPRFLKFL